jgi:dTMP kinase
LKLKPGALVVLEGMDRTGKSTQRDRLRSLPWNVRPEIAHMPSGLVPSTNALYRGLEAGEFESALATQLLHLACHSENMAALRDARRERGLILDRWWWSTMAYGWYGRLHLTVSYEQFLGAVSMVWQNFDADVIFVFLTRFSADERNTSAIEDGYRRLAQQSARAMIVPAGDPSEVTTLLIDTMRERGVLLD